MKRILVVLVIAGMMSIGTTYAQEMKQGMSLFNAGFGFLPGWGLNASFDYGLTDAWGPGIFTVGGYVGFGTWGDSYSSFPHYINYRVNAVAFAPRATYRYAINRSFELYGTAMLGAVIRFDSVDFERNNSNGNRNHVFFATTAGCRYSISGNVSVFAEIGYNEISYMSGGLSFSF